MQPEVVCCFHVFTIDVGREYENASSEFCVFSNTQKRYGAHVQWRIMRNGTSNSINVTERGSGVLTTPLRRNTGNYRMDAPREYLSRCHLGTNLLTPGGRRRPMQNATPAHCLA